MGRHSAERDTGENGPQINAERLTASSRPIPCPEAVSEPGDAEDLTLPESMFDPDDCAAWNFEPFLRAIVNVELPEDPQ